MRALVNRLRLEAAERAKDPDWFDESFSKAIVRAADELEAKDKLIADLVDAMEEALEVLEWAIIDRALSKANHNRDSE